MVDLSGLEGLIPPVAQALGVEPASALLGLGALVTAANIAGRLIPDTATGFLGGLRKAAKVIGMVVPNRIAPRVTVNDVARAVVTRQVTDLASDITAAGKAVLRDQLPDSGRE